MQREFAELAPWLALLEVPPSGCEELAMAIRGLLPPTLALGNAEERSAEAVDLLASAASAELSDAAQSWAASLRAALEKGAAASRELRDAFRAVG